MSDTLSYCSKRRPKNALSFVAAILWLLFCSSFNSDCHRRMSGVYELCGEYKARVKLLCFATFWNMTRHCVVVRISYTSSSLIAIIIIIIIMWHFTTSDDKVLQLYHTCLVFLLCVHVYDDDESVVKLESNRLNATNCWIRCLIS